MADFDPSGVSLIATETGSRLDAPATNPAMQLADALGDVHPQLGAFLDQLGSQLQKRQAARAQADVLSTSGEAFADAVREGKILPTQNPWYINAYQEDASAVQGRAAVAKVVQDSQTWTERNDPIAYANRLNQEIGKAQEGFTGVNQAKGFASTAEPLRAQALSLNEQYNVQRINLEHNQNVSSLAGQALVDALSRNPKAGPEELFQAMEPMHQQWLSTGGTEGSWKEVAFNSIIGAGFNKLDTSVLNLARAPYQGGPALADIADPTGKPYGEQLGQADFYIQRMRDRIDSDAAKAATQQDRIAGQQFYADAVQHFGYDLLTGKVTDAQMLQYSQAKGYSAQAFAFGAYALHQFFEGVTGLNKDLIAVSGNTDAGLQARTGLAFRAVTQGLTKGVMDDLKRYIASGVITEEAAAKVISEAAQTTRQHDQEGRSDRREAQVEAHYDTAQARQFANDARLRGKDRREEVNQDAIGFLQGAGKDGKPRDAAAIRDPKIRAQLNSIGNAAHDGWLSNHPGDYDGAEKAQRLALGNFTQQRIRRKSAQTPGGGNLVQVK